MRNTQKLVWPDRIRLYSLWLTKTEVWKNMSWYDDFRFLLQCADGRVTIWHERYESVEPSSCLVSTLQAGVVVKLRGDCFFLAHIKALNTSWTSFECHCPAEYCCWPCASLGSHCQQGKAPFHKAHMIWSRFHRHASGFCMFHSPRLSTKTPFGMRLKGRAVQPAIL